MTFYVSPLCLCVTGTSLLINNTHMLVNSIRSTPYATGNTHSRRSQDKAPHPCAGCLDPLWEQRTIHWAAAETGAFFVAQPEVVFPFKPWTRTAPRQQEMVSICQTAPSSHQYSQHTAQACTTVTPAALSGERIPSHPRVALKIRAAPRRRAAAAAFSPQHAGPAALHTVSVPASKNLFQTHPNNKPLPASFPSRVSVRKTVRRQLWR